MEKKEISDMGSDEERMKTINARLDEILEELAKINMKLDVLLKPRRL
jgi:hypothetical protein